MLRGEQQDETSTATTSPVVAVAASGTSSDDLGNTRCRGALIWYSSISKAFKPKRTTSKFHLEGSKTMISLGQAIRRHLESTRQERELNRAFRTAPGSDMRTELAHLAQFNLR